MSATLGSVRGINFSGGALTLTTLGGGAARGIGVARGAEREIGVARGTEREIGPVRGTARGGGAERLRTTAARVGARGAGTDGSFTIL